MLRDLLTSIGIVALVGVFWIFCVFQSMGVPIEKPTIPIISVCDPYEHGQAGNEMIYYLIKLPLNELDDQKYYQPKLIHANIEIPKEILYGCRKA